MFRHRFIWGLPGLGARDWSLITGGQCCGAFWGPTDEVTCFLFLALLLSKRDTGVRRANVKRCVSCGFAMDLFPSVLTVERVSGDRFLFGGMD